MSRLISRLLIASSLFATLTFAADAGKRYSEDEVHILQRVPPAYPPIARQIHLSGVVILDLAVTQEGEVGGTSIVSGNPILSAGAVGAAKRWKFAPIMEDGKPVPATVRVSFKFAAAN